MSKASLVTILFFLASQAIAQSAPIEYKDPINPDGWPSLSVGLAADFHTQYVSIGSSPIEKVQDAGSRRVTLWANYTHPVASTLSIVASFAFAPRQQTGQTEFDYTPIKGYSQTVSVSAGIKIFFPKRKPGPFDGEDDETWEW